MKKTRKTQKEHENSREEDKKKYLKRKKAKNVTYHLQVKQAKSHYLAHGGSILMKIIYLPRGCICSKNMYIKRNRRRRTNKL